MKNNDQIIDSIRNNLKYILSDDFEHQDYDDYNMIIKNIVAQRTKNDNKLEYQDVYDKDSNYLEFKSLDEQDESKYIVYINEHRIKDRISDISSSKDLDEKKQLSLELLYDIVSNSYIVSNQYKNRTSHDIEQNLIGINNLTNKNTEIKTDYAQKKDALDNLRFDIEEALNNSNIDDRNLVINSLKEYEKKEIINASIDEIKDYISKTREIVDEYKQYPGEEEIFVFRRLIGRYKKLESDINKYMDGDREEYEFSQENDKIRVLAKKLAGNMDINYSEIENYSGDYSGSIEEYELLLEEIKNAEEFLNSNRSYLDIDDESVPKKIRELYTNIEKDNEEFELIDPDAAIKQHIIDNYPEMSIILGKYLEKTDLENVIKRLPDNVKNEVNSVLSENGQSYEDFIAEISKKGKNESSKLERKVNVFNKKYGEDLYEKYKDFTPEEKEAFFKYSTIDDSVAQGVLERLKDEAKRMQPNVRKEEVSNIINREYISKENIGNVLDEYYEFKQIRKESVPVLNDAISTRIQGEINGDKKLNNIFSKYISSNDVAKALNNIEYEDLINIKKKIDIRNLTQQLDEESKIPYKEDLKKFGTNLLNIVNFKKDEDFENILNSTNNDTEKEEIVGIIQNQILDKKHQEMDIISTVEKNLDSVQNIFKDEDFLSAKRYCNLKYQSMRYNLAEKAALNNVKVVENDEIGLQKLKNKIDYIDAKELEISKQKNQNLEHKKQIINSNKFKLSEKIQNVIENRKLNVTQKLKNISNKNQQGGACIE